MAAVRLRGGSTGLVLGLSASQQAGAPAPSGPRQVLYSVKQPYITLHELEAQLSRRRCALFNLFIGQGLPSRKLYDDHRRLTERQNSHELA